jgi:hypothetical protein
MNKVVKTRELVTGIVALLDKHNAPFDVGLTALAFSYAVAAKEAGLSQHASVDFLLSNMKSLEE